MSIRRLHLRPVYFFLIVGDINACGQGLGAVGGRACEDVAVPDVAVGVRVSAATGVGGMSRPRDGGSDDGFGKGVTERLGDGRLVIHLTRRAYVLGVTALGTAGCVIYAGQRVSLGGNEVGGEGESAFASAGVDGASAFGTGGIGHGSAQIVSEGLNVIGAVVVSAIAREGGISLLGTGRCGHGGGDGVAVRLGEITFTSKQNLLVDIPESVNAVIQAAGPGREVTSIPA